MKNKKGIFFSLLCLLIAGCFASLSASNAAFSATPLRAGEWFNTWKICGPIPLKAGPVETHQHLEGFYTDFLKANGGETGRRLDTTRPVKVGDVAYPWQAHVFTDTIVDMGLTVGQKEYTATYLYTEKVADEAGLWLLALGSDDGARVWVNGKPVWDGAAPRYVNADENLIPVQLKKGVNRFLFKLENKEGNFYFCMRVLPYSSEKLQVGAGRLYDLLPLKDGTIDVVPHQLKGVMDGLVSGVRVQLFDRFGKLLADKKCARSEVTKLIETPLSGNYYVGKVDLRLKTGEKMLFEQEFFAGIDRSYSVFANGKTDYTIVVAPDASSSERFAARELQHWLAQAGGVTLPIDSVTAGVKGKRILVGYNAEVAALTEAAKPDFRDESFTYANFDGDVVVYGGGQRGTMYGVYTLLENELGCRWYTSTVTVVPKRAEWKFQQLYCHEKPGIAVRNTFYLDAFDGMWSARNKNNGRMGTIDMPGGCEGYWGCHTFDRFVPIGRYFKTHPEYFSEKDGKRINGRTQLCLSNPDVFKLCLEGVRKVMREDPDHLIYDVSQNDWENPCQCEKCQKIVRETGGESGILIWFVNQIADSIKEEFPDKYIGTFAYTYSRKPPTNIKPRENVVVRLCSIECCFVHDFYSCQQAANRSFVEDMERWGEIAPNIYVWDYVVTFSQYSAPFPNFYVLQPNIKAFQKNHAIGIMEQGAYQSPGAEFAELRAYLLSKLLWNPDCDVEAVINDFMYGYYGRSGQYVRQYFDLMHSLIKPKLHMNIYPSPQHAIYTEAFLKEATEIFEQAERVADNDEILRRVELASLPIYFLRCMREPRRARVDGSYDRVMRIAEREKMDKFAEWGLSKRDFCNFMNAQ